MICPCCKSEMYISTWDGWIWMCPICDHKDREASSAEIDAQEKEINEYIARNNGKEG